MNRNHKAKTRTNELLNDTKMSKQELVVSILASNETDDGIIDQGLYDFLVESMREHFELKRIQAQRAVTMVLRSLYMEVA